jgi:hypothetical protein
MISWTLSFEGIGLKFQAMINIYPALGAGRNASGAGQWLILTGTTLKRGVSIVVYPKKNKDCWPRMHS